MESHPTPYRRWLERRVAEALLDTPVVLIAGPRQAGKTTLARCIASSDMRYLTLDDPTTLLAAQEDPAGFLRSVDRAVIDEIQRAPGLMLALKKEVDERRVPGRFLLTGSANLMTLPAVADSLAGRIEVQTLLPLSQGEIHRRESNWLDTVFSAHMPAVGECHVGSELVERVLCGGYPEALRRPVARRREAWLRQYMEALIRRDVREIAVVEKLDQLSRFLRALAQVAGQLCNYSQLGAQVGLDYKTAARYMGILEQMYVLARVEAWSGNHLSRIVKAPKLHFIDSGLLAVACGLGMSSIQRDRLRFGQLLESFVYAELCKAMAIADGNYRLLHYRDHDQLEVDFVLEDDAGNVVGVEVKARATVKASDFRGLYKLAALAGDRWVGGIVLYDGSQPLPMGDRLWALPIATLWG